MRMNSVIALATPNVSLCVSGTRLNSCWTTPGIGGSNFGETQIGVRW